MFRGNDLTNLEKDIEYARQKYEEEKSIQTLTLEEREKKGRIYSFEKQKDMDQKRFNYKYNNYLEAKNKYEIYLSMNENNIEKLIEYIRLYKKDSKYNKETRFQFKHLNPFKFIIDEDRIDLLEALVNLKYEPSSRDIIYAMERNKIDIVKWLFSKGIFPSTYKVYLESEKTGNFAILNEMVKNGFLPTKTDLRMAYRKKQIRNIAWLEKGGITLTVRDKKYINKDIIKNNTKVAISVADSRRINI